jgi:eukaryotic-like serine/threonine-protein kinase
MNSRLSVASANGPSRTVDLVSSPINDRRVVAALEDYVELMRGGSPPTRTEFLALHHSIADILADPLAGLELAQAAAGDLAPTGSVRDLVEDTLLSATLGEYRIIREVGRGGMGIVYEAEQVPLGRRVALKVLPSTASLDPRHRQRFRIEAQAAALLHHEHIVPVFAIGCDRGVDYYAMQFIDGQSLNERIRSPLQMPPQYDRVEPTTTVAVGPLRRSSHSPFPPRLTGSSLGDRRHCKAAAQLALQAAFALEHAHEIGVIHRDIKPSNLLIDVRDHLWIADFGLARLPQDEHDLTRTGDLVGTLRYMSPEQVRGDRASVDARTDLYGLGVTLYELLTLRPAFSGRNRDELVRRILDEDPVPPRRINPSIPRDLETIILKAMEKEPSARYRTARALADDLRRFLDDEPIRARRPTVVDRAVKWSRRHRTATIASTIALLVTLTISTAVLWVSNRRTDALLRRTDALLDKNRVARLEGEEAFQRSLGTLDQIIRSVSSESDPSKTETAKRVYPWAIEFYTFIGRRFSESESISKEVLAKAHRQAGFCRLNMGDRRGRDDYRRAIRGFQDVAARFPDRLWYRTRLIETLLEYSGLLPAPADAALADELFRSALPVAEALLGDKNADLHCYRIGLIGPFNDLAWKLVRRPLARESDAALAVRLARKAVAWEPGQAAYWNTLGVAYYRQGDWSAASTAIEKSIELGNGGDATDWFVLASTLHRQGRSDQARQWFDRAVQWVERNPGLDKVRAAEILGFRDEASRILGGQGPLSHGTQCLENNSVEK